MSDAPDQHADLQRQIVELRLQISHMGENQSALIEHVTRREVMHQMEILSITQDDVRYVREARAARDHRRNLMRDIGTHIAKLASGGALGYVAYSLWERIKKDGNS